MIIRKIIFILSLIPFFLFSSPNKSKLDNSPDKISRTDKTAGMDRTEKSKSAIDEAERMTIPEEKSKEEQTKVSLNIIFHNN